MEHNKNKKKNNHKKRKYKGHHQLQDLKSLQNNLLQKKVYNHNNLLKSLNKFQNK
jgi:hypothetical protein